MLRRSMCKQPLQMVRSVKSLLLGFWKPVIKKNCIYTYTRATTQNSRYTYIIRRHIALEYQLWLWRIQNKFLNLQLKTQDCRHDAKINDVHLQDTQIFQTALRGKSSSHSSLPVEVQAIKKKKLKEREKSNGGFRPTVQLMMGAKKVVSRSPVLRCLCLDNASWRAWSAWYICTLSFDFGKGASGLDKESIPLQANEIGEIFVR